MMKSIKRPSSDDYFMEIASVVAKRYHMSTQSCGCTLCEK